MSTLFASTGMTIVTLLVFTIEGLSLVALWCIADGFWKLRIRQEDLLSKFQHTFEPLSSPTRARTPSMLLLLLYVCTTLLMTIASLILFIFQPHLL